MDGDQVGLIPASSSRSIIERLSANARNGRGNLTAPSMVLLLVRHPIIAAKFGFVFAALAVFLPSCAQRLPLPKGASWNSTTATFIWWGGAVTLPIGFSYEVDQGADTFEGHFTSPDGKVIIRHDIGGYAGAWANPKQSKVFKETTIDGARVWIAQRDWPDGKGSETTLMAVTFPDSGCANFFLTSSNGTDGSLIEFMAQSFRPRGDARFTSSCR